ncbi:MAG: hypothetical protein F6K55_47105, partial [Moorea sp. SIO4A3]|nr:hypothetical protein [Moorena sp. SIO4A3]
MWLAKVNQTKENNNLNELTYPHVDIIFLPIDISFRYFLSSLKRQLIYFIKILTLKILDQRIFQLNKKIEDFYLSIKYDIENPYFYKEVYSGRKINISHDDYHCDIINITIT